MAANAHLKVAVTTNSLINVDAGFADARQVVIYHVTRDGSSFVDAMKFGAPTSQGTTSQGTGGAKPGTGRNGGACMMAADLATDAASGDLLTSRVNALAGCSILVTRGISDLAAMRVQSADIFPVKTESSHDIDSVLDRLQAMLNGRPPLWLRRVLRDEHGQPVPLDEQSV